MRINESIPICFMLQDKHRKSFVVEARLNSNVIGRGEGSSKREAEQRAARQALVLFGAMNRETE